MAKVPSYDSPQVSLRPVATPYSNDRATPDAFGAGIGRIADKAADVVQGMRKKADDFRVDMADLEFGKAVNDGLHGEDGFLNKRGENALNAAPTMEGFEKVRQKISRALANDEQRQTFEMRSLGRVNQAKASIDGHSARERFTVYGSAAEGHAKLALQDAALAPDVEGANSAIGKALTSPDGGPGPLRRYWREMGLTAEDMKAREGTFRADAYGAALSQILAKGDGAGARAYFSQVRGALGEKGPKFEHDIHVVEQSQGAEVLAGTIVRGATDRAYGWVDPTSALAAVDTIPEGPMRDEVRQRVEHRVQKAVALKKEAGEQKFQEAISVYYAGGKNLGAQGMAPIKAWLLDPKNGAADLWRRLELEDGRERREDRATRDRSNEAAMAEFLANADRDRVRVNIDREYLGKADKETRDKMRKHLNDSKKRVEEDDGVGETQMLRLVDSTADAVDGVRTSTPARNQLKAHMNRWWAQQRGEKKREPTTEEINSELGKALELFDTGFWGTNKFGFQLQPGEDAEAQEPTDQPYAPNRAVGPAPATTGKQPLEHRALQLKREGKSKEEARRILDAEGY